MFVDDYHYHVLLRDTFFSAKLLITFVLLCLAIGDDLLEFHQAVVSTLRDADEIPIPLDPAPMPSMNIPHHSMMPPSGMMNEELGRISDVINTDQPLDPEDELDPGKYCSKKARCEN